MFTFVNIRSIRSPDAERSPTPIVICIDQQWVNYVGMYISGILVGVIPTYFVCTTSSHHTNIIKVKCMSRRCCQPPPDRRAGQTLWCSATISGWPPYVKEAPYIRHLKTGTHGSRRKVFALRPPVHLLRWWWWWRDAPPKYLYPLKGPSVWVFLTRFASSYWLKRTWLTAPSCNM